MSLNIPVSKRGAVCNGWWSEYEKAMMHGAAACPVHDRPAGGIAFGALPPKPTQRQPKENSNA